VNLALFADDGTRLPLRLAGDAAAAVDERVLELTEAGQHFVFEDMPAKPTPSLCRGLSAPVRVHFDYAPVQLARLLKHETGGFDRWNAAQQLAACAFDEARAREHAQAATDAWLDALASVFAARADIDPALLAGLLTPPSELELGARQAPFDPDAVHAAREALEDALARRLGNALMPAYHELHADEAGALDQDASARRRLKGRVLALLSRHDPAGGAELAFAQCRDARGMTDRLAALSVLVRHDARQAGEGLRLYRQRFDGDALTLDKWFMLQATTPAHATLERVQALEADSAFTLANPNRVHALFGAFARGNPVAFHRPDGAGHRWFADKLAQIDARNPQLSARLAKAFEDWTRLETGRRGSAETSLRALLAHGQHSPDLREILTRMLATGETDG
jgi:aminopeptidase N